MNYKIIFFFFLLFIHETNDRILNNYNYFFSGERKEIQCCNAVSYFLAVLANASDCFNYPETTLKLYLLSGSASRRYCLHEPSVQYLLLVLMLLSASARADATAAILPRVHQILLQLLIHDPLLCCWYCSTRVDWQCTPRPYMMLKF